MAGVGRDDLVSDPSQRAASRSGSDIRDRVVWLESKASNFATKTDIADLRSELLKEEVTRQRWLIGTILAVLVSVVATLIRTFF